MKHYMVCMVSVLISVLPAKATTIKVPQDQPTIQAGINAANAGDTVLVSPGFYAENIDFLGKAITVTSSDGPDVTTIDGGQLGPVVAFHSGEGASSVVSGFTLQDGVGISTYGYDGGGISIENSSPTVATNTIQGNSANSGSGGGISVQNGSPRIEHNSILENAATFGGGIYVLGSAGTRVIGNLIIGNTAAAGGGIEFFGSGYVLVQNNIFHANSADQGGGIAIVNEADEVIVDNLFAANQAQSGSEIYSSIPTSEKGFRIINNTIVGDDTGADAAVVADGFNTNAVIGNNVIFAVSSQTALLCNPVYHDGPPIVGFNDVFSQTGTAYAGSCAGMSGTKGNISNNPEFGSPQNGNFKLSAGSPAINAGHNLNSLPKTDLAGKPRVVGGVVDMGAYEYQGAR
jgi:parallel beta-helix repeat protein